MVDPVSSDGRWRYRRCGESGTARRDAGEQGQLADGSLASFGQECDGGSRGLQPLDLLELAASELETDARLISAVLTRSALQQVGVSAVGFMFRGVHRSQSFYRAFLAKCHARKDAGICETRGQAQPVKVEQPYPAKLVLG